MKIHKTIFYTLGQQLGTRGQQDHHDIYLENLRITCQELLSTSSGPKGLQSTKTWQGGPHKPGRMVAQKAFAVGGPKCRRASSPHLLGAGSALVSTMRLQCPHQVKGKGILRQVCSTMADLSVKLLMHAWCTHTHLSAFCRQASLSNLRVHSMTSM